MLMDKRNESATIGNRDDELLSRVRLREPDYFDVDQPGLLPGAHDGHFGYFRPPFWTHDPQCAVRLQRRLQLLESRKLRLFVRAHEDRVAAFRDAADRKKRHRAPQFLEEGDVLNANR